MIFELFVPYDFLVSVRCGPHYLGLEWQADMDDVRAAVADHGIRIVRDIGLALHTHPADSFGVSHEFYATIFTIATARCWAARSGLSNTGATNIPSA